LGEKASEFLIQAPVQRRGFSFSGAGAEGWPHVRTNAPNTKNFKHHNG